MEEKILRPAAEQRYAAQLAALAKWDSGNPRPQGWKLSPKAVRLFILGSWEPIEGVTIDKKYLFMNSVDYYISSNINISIKITFTTYITRWTIYYFFRFHIK